MKHLKLTALFLFVSILLFAQEKKNSITITGIAAHYENYEERDLIGPFKGYYEDAISPGMECLYSRQISNTISIRSGFNYIYGKNSSYISEPTRFRFHEISLPILLKANFLHREKGVFSISTGLYLGRTLNIKIEVPGKYEDWHKPYNPESLDGYSDDVNFMDLYFDVGYSIKLHNGNTINLNPFLKYRANKTWLSTHQKETQYGLKFSYSFKL